MLKKNLITMALVLSVMLLAVGTAVAGSDECDDGTDPLKFEDDTGVDFGNVSVGDTFAIGPVTIEITEIKSGESEALAFNWTSTQPVCKLLVKAGQTDSGWIDVEGATSGSGETPDERRAISHISFCFGCGDNEIPEFPTVALPIAAILGLAFIITRRRNE